MDANIKFLLSLIFIMSMMNCSLSRKTDEIEHVQKRGVMDGFSEGLKYAGQMFGINTAADVADLVAKAFSTATQQNKPDLASSSFHKNQKQSYHGYSKESDEETSHERQQEFEQPNDQDSMQSADEDQGNLSVKQTHTNSRPSTHTKESANVDFGSVQLITGILRMIGFDATKLGALAINALIMIAQAIGSSLMGAFVKKNPSTLNADSGVDGNTGPEAVYDSHNRHEPRHLVREGTPIDWFLNSPTKDMRKLLSDATDIGLTHKLTSMIEKYESQNGEGESASCLKMLICKSSPFIWGMQKSMTKRLNGNLTDSPTDEPRNNSIINTKGFFTHLPNLNEYRQHGASCEKLYGAQCSTASLLKRR